MTRRSIREIAQDLAGQSERVCRRYLSNGSREGNYWLVGDIRNTPGRSLYLRLVPRPDGTAAAGKWTDAQSGEHGDLLDIIRSATPSGTLAEALVEARRFLSLPDSGADADPDRPGAAHSGSPEKARRLLRLCAPIQGTLAETYLQGRDIAIGTGGGTLRFHPRCWYRRSRDDRADVPSAMPALIAAVTDNAGRITGAHRTWLAFDGCDKAPVAYPRRAMGGLLGNGVRFGETGTMLVAGEGLETILSVRTAIPALSVVAALSAAHLAALEFPPDLRRLYVAREPDSAGRKAFLTLSRRAADAGVIIRPLDSEGSDFNADLRSLGAAELAIRLKRQFDPDDLKCI